MATQRTLVTVTYTSLGVNYSTTMYSSAFGTYGPARGKKWHECFVCGFSFPEDRLTFYHGRPYCRENMCYLEAQQVERPRMVLHGRRGT